MIEVIGKPIVLPNGTTLPFSPATRAGDFLFISGQLGMGDDGKVVAEDIGSQTRQIFQRLRSILELAGGRLDQIVKINVWITDKADFAELNAAYREFFPARPPARSTVVSDLLIPGARIEIDAIAFLG